MRFGLFYEHQLPRPWGDEDEYVLLQNALEQVGIRYGRIESSRRQLGTRKLGGREFDHEPINHGSVRDDLGTGAGEANLRLRHGKVCARQLPRQVALV